LAREIEHVESSDACGAERFGIRSRTPALQHQHREPLVAREEIAAKAGEGKGAGRGGGYQVSLTHTEKFDENASKLHDIIVRAPGMAIAAADREAGATIEFCGRVEIADRVNDMVETVGHPSSASAQARDHFTDENAVGTSNWLTMLPTIWPSASVFARAAIQSGSAWKAAHFFSRSASDSQARK
jgi:hypothetical protein